MKIQRFTDLIAWQKGHSVVIKIYKFTKLFPKEEIFVLVSQMRRCVISITSNIAEGFSRKNKKEKNQFYYIALGSTTELENQLIIAKDLGYISLGDFEKLMNDLDVVEKLLNGLLKSSTNHV
jgi:four helix bundle protein